MQNHLPQSFFRRDGDIDSGSGKRLENEQRERRRSEERVIDLEGKLRKADEVEAALRLRIEELEKDTKRLNTSADQDRQDRMGLQSELSKQENINDIIKSRFMRLQSINASLTQQLTIKNAEAQQLGNELTWLKKRHEETQNLLERRTHEFKDSQAFLSKPDLISSADVISLVSALNCEVLQTAAFIADSFEFSFDQVHARDGGLAEMEDARTKLQYTMGTSLVDVLGRVKHEDDPTLIQIALQSSIVEFSRWMISTWDYDVLQAEQSLMEIYQGVRETENQAVAGRWRALARTHAQKIAFRKNAQHSIVLVTNLSEVLVLVLVAAGCSGTYDETYKRVASEFGGRILGLVDMATRLNHAMGEEVTSVDLWPACVEFGTAFNGEDMRDVYAEDGAGSEDAHVQKRQVVLCTTELGLIRSEKTQVDGRPKFSTTFLVKPTVALESVVDGMSEVVGLEDDV